MNIVEQIKQERLAQLTDEQKEGILTYLRDNLKYSDSAIIFGAKHYPEYEWVRSKFDNHGYCEAPYNLHPAIADWLSQQGFKTERAYNKMGIEQGMKVWI